ncbi:trace amine-associated receptor 13c-like [Anguilla anguilla]|uniref:trace amine-associated receptor 13c-like n=1 Tax=Anguilla anguilla TaxID=7936 RepID=UPI0015B0F6EC|nr:trace amine-associated receptor 13c-like [Anguilla anguilla]
MNLTGVHQGESCVHSLNSSCLSEPSTQTDVLVYVSVIAAIFLAVCGNLLVIISICHFKQLHTPTNFLILSLAVADCLVGLIILPFEFNIFFLHRCFGAMYCNIGYIASFHLTCVSIYNVAFIAMDRYFAISNPFLYCTKMNVNITLKTMSTLWLCSFIYNVLLLHFSEGLTDLKENITCMNCFVSVNSIWTIVDFAVVFFLPCMTIVILYIKIFNVAKKHTNKIRCVRKHYSNRTKNNDLSAASERKAGRTVGILVSVFLLCVVPYYTCAFLDEYMRTPSAYTALLCMSILLYVNSSLNPIIYALFYPWFQKSIKIIVTLRICHSESSLMNVLARET